MDLGRLFHARGAEVHFADCIGFAIARASRACARYVRTPAPRFEPARYATALARHCEQAAVDLLIPACEEVFYLAMHRDLFAPRVDCFFPGIDVLAALHDKGRFAEWAGRNGGEVLAPETVRLADAAALDALRPRLAALVLKPAFSRFGSATLIRPSREQARSIRPEPRSPWIAQAYIDGEEFCSYAVAREGRLAAHCAYRSDYHVGVAASIYFDPDVPPQVAAAAQAFAANVAKAFCYTGQLAFDFRRERGTEKLYVLECNPRATSGIHLFAPHDGLAEAIASLHPGAVCHPGARARMIAPAMLTKGLCDALARAGGMRKLLRDVRRADDVICRDGDWAPLPFQVLSLAELCGTAIAHRIGMARAATFDIEWNGEQPAAPAGHP